MDNISSWSLPTRFRLPNFLDHVIPPYSSSPFSYFLPTSLPGISCARREGWQNLLFGKLFTIYSYVVLPAQLFMSLRVLVLSGYISSSALNTVVLLVVLEYPSTFLAVATCTVSSLLPFTLLIVSLYYSAI